MTPQAAGGGTPKAKLVVRIFDYAGVPPQVLAGAERQAVRMYQQAGILLSWVECGFPGQDEEKFLACEHLGDPFGFFVNIIGPRMAAGIPRPGRSGTSFEKHAIVFYQEVERAAEDGRFSKSLILGCVMTHEIGHLLLGGNGHTTGIMADTF